METRCECDKLELKIVLGFKTGNLSKPAVKVFDLFVANVTILYPLKTPERLLVISEGKI